MVIVRQAVGAEFIYIESLDADLIKTAERQVTVDLVANSQYLIIRDKETISRIMNDMVFAD